MCNCRAPKLGGGRVALPHNLLHSYSPLSRVVLSPTYPEIKNCSPRSPEVRSGSCSRLSPACRTPDRRNIASRAAAVMSRISFLLLAGALAVACSFVQTGVPLRGKLHCPPLL